MYGVLAPSYACSAIGSVSAATDGQCLTLPLYRLTMRFLRPSQALFSMLMSSIVTVGSVSNVSIVLSTSSNEYAFKVMTFAEPIFLQKMRSQRLCLASYWAT